jgi:hypothetical protein
MYAPSAFAIPRTGKSEQPRSLGTGETLRYGGEQYFERKMVEGGARKLITKVYTKLLFLILGSEMSIYSSLVSLSDLICACAYPLFQC